MGNTTSNHKIRITADDKATPVIKGIDSSLARLSSFVGGAALVGAFANATKAALSFEQGLAKTATLLPVADRNMQGFAKGLEKIRASGAGGSLHELTEGLYEAVSAGVPAGKAIDFLGVAAKASKAGFTDMRTSVDGLTTVLNSYKMSADETNKVADILFVTQNRGKTTFGEMAQTLGQLLPIASSVGARFQDVAAAIASLTMQGIPTAVAITGIRATIAAFIEKGDAGKIATLGLAGAIEELYNKMGGDSKKLQDYLGRVEALNTVAALTGENFAGFAESLRQTSNAAGTADDAFKTFTDTAQGRLDKLAAKIEIIKTSLAQGFVDTVSAGIPNTEQSIAKQAESWTLLGNAIGYALRMLSFFPGLAFQGLEKIGTAGGNLAGAIGTGSLVPAGMGLNGNSGPVGSNPGRLPDVFGPPQSPWQSFIGPMPFIGPMKAAGDAVADALNIVAIKLANWGPTISGSRFSEGRGIIRPLGFRGGGVGIQAGRGGGRLSGGLFDTRFNVGSVPEAENSFELPMQGLTKLQERILMIAPAFQQMMSAVTNTIVQGLMTGKGQIVDVLNSLKGAILSILAQIAAKMAAVGLLSLIPGVGSFKSVFDLLGGGIFSSGGNNRRMIPIGAGSGSGSFGMRPIVVNIGTVYGAEADALAIQIEQRIAYRMRSGTSKMIYSAAR